MTEPFLSVYGHITIDQIVSVGKFPDINETVDIMSKKTTLCGTGTNIAIEAARLGVPTALCGFIGRDFPATYLEEMEESGLITDEVVTVDDFETSQCTVINDPDLRQKVIFYQGPQGFATRIGKDLLKNASRSKMVHFCTGEPDYYLHLMEGLSGKGPVIAADPAQETYRLWDSARLEKLVSMSDRLFCNSFEAKVIAERLGLEDVTDLAKELVVRTDGSEGSAARIGGRIVRIPVVKGGEPVDATGCGDTYRAGFYAGLYHGYSVEESLVLAASVASFTIEKVGALTNTPTWEQVEERAKDYLK